MQVLPSIASRKKHRNHSTTAGGGETIAGKLAKEHILKAKQIDKAGPGHSPREERKWRIGSQGKQETKLKRGQEGFSATRETKFPNGELWEQFESQSPEAM
jgi:hypothetical protein